jgi:hypothetical protein
MCGDHHFFRFLQKLFQSIDIVHTIDLNPLINKDIRR